MSKRKYRATDVKDASAHGLVERLASPRLVVGIDVAKFKMFACLMDQSQHVHQTIHWQHPHQTPLFIDYLSQLRDQGGIVEVALEPSGVYGDALRCQLQNHDLPVHRVSPKRCHDAAEVYDGTPSLHDAKSAAIIAKLHLDAKSHPWPLREEHERELTAAVKLAEVFTKQFQQNRNRLEALTQRHWPELTLLLDLDSATLLELLAHYGGPARVADCTDEADALMKRVGKNMLAQDKITNVLNSAANTIGVPQTEGERRLLAALASEARRNQQQANSALRDIERLTQRQGSVRHLRPVVGAKTSAVLIAVAGDPRNYASAASFVKSVGLNLKEVSSGKKKGGLHITKRGSGLARMMLYMAVLRMLQTNGVMRAWYDKKLARMGQQQKTKAVVALMRKLAAALWHVAKGEAFDAHRLFDTTRLELPQPTQPVAMVQT